MEDAGKDQQVAPPSGKSKLRYQLRSAVKSKDEKPSPKTATLTSATRRGRPASGVSKSMNVLDLSGKDKPAKPPRRLSIPTKANGTPAAAKRIDSMTPISETRPRRSATSHAKSDTPSSEVSKSGIRRQFSRLSTASYWLSQIKLAETEAKHAVSLGFFKLASEAGCEPQQQMRNELKAYARKHELDEHGDFLKELFSSFNITESLEELRESVNSSEVVLGGTKSSDDDNQSATSSIKSRNLKPKSLNTDVARTSTAVRSANKEMLQKKSPIVRARGSVNRSSVTSKGTTGTRTAQTNSEKVTKQKCDQGKTTINKQEEKPVNMEDDAENAEENKENMDSMTQEPTTVEVM
uniref:Uncharacterized protein n=1 Tax=Kalanchoe fedtschenkoi TaxID=63787 RepID=A0A7N0TWP7_KALFE